MSRPAIRPLLEAFRSRGHKLPPTDKQITWAAIRLAADKPGFDRRLRTLAGFLRTLKPDPGRVPGAKAEIQTRSFCDMGWGMLHWAAHRDAEIAAKDGWSLLGLGSQRVGRMSWSGNRSTIWNTARMGDREAMADDVPKSRAGPAGSRAGPTIGQPGHPIGSDAWERIRTDPSSWYNAARAKRDRAADDMGDGADPRRVAGKWLHLRDMRQARKRSLP